VSQLFLFVFEREVCYHRNNYNEEKAGSEESQPAAVPKKGRRHLTGDVTMITQKLEISGIPALLYGKESRKVYLYVHGKMGCKEEALPFAELACPAGYQVLAVDLPEHGERRGSSEKLLPWVAAPELEAVYFYAAERWKNVSLRATSIGAWFSMLALQEKPLRSALLLSPVVDMEDLITNMMQWANVSEAQLKEAGEISTDFDETLSWQYLCWVREHPYRWKVPTQVLYGAKDNLTSRSVLEQFKQRTGAHLTIMVEGEHWFHTELQLAVLQEWERAHI
jgi:alpha-beta hydrolase superfamily lysophospholipase